MRVSLDSGSLNWCSCRCLSGGDRRFRVLTPWTGTAGEPDCPVCRGDGFVPLVPADLAEALELLRRILIECESRTSFFGEKPQFDRWLFEVEKCLIKESDAELTRTYDDEEPF